MNSIKATRDFARIYSAGARGRSDGITAVVQARAENEPSRLGIAVPKTHGSAVTRNRIRRRLKAAFVVAAIPAGTDVILRPDKETAGVAFQELVSHVEKAVTRAVAS